MTAAAATDGSPRWQSQLRAALAGEGSAWLFVGKSVLAAYLAAWLAMWLQLEQPATTMITVGIVMHPHSGMVLAKSFYRALGTLAGSVFGLALMGLFPQERELFLLSLSLWVALCAGGSMLYRNFMSYGFVLAGYTAAIVTLPVINHPLGAFDSAVMRVSEVMLGIVVAGLVSDVVFPERLRTVLRQGARQQFAQFVEFVRGSMNGTIARGDMEQAHLRFVRSAVQLENLRASVIFEDPEVRARSRQMRYLNGRYMAASTSFQSLHHLINRLQRRSSEAAAALIALYRPVGAAMTPATGNVDEPTVLLPLLEEASAGVPAQAAALREALPLEARLDFDTGAALLQRFVDELHVFTQLEVELREGRVRTPVERVHFQRGNDLVGAAVTVLRTFLTMATLSAFWIGSSWPYGASAMLIATIFSGLFAAAPHPLQSAGNTLAGYVLGIAGAFVTTFWLLPGSDGFVMLIAASLPLLLLGPYLSTRASLPGVGAGYAIGFVYMLGLKNPMTYSPVRFLNDGLSQILGVGMSGVAFAFLPGVTGSAWQRLRQTRQLRAQVVLAARAPLPGLTWRFESISRDLFQQVVEHTQPGSADAHELLAWALSVHECGRALIELRSDLAAGHGSAALREAAPAAVQAVARLYQAPDVARWREADRAVQHALDACPSVEQASSLARLHLHQLRSALRDDESALAPYMPNTGEPSHAA